MYNFLKRKCLSSTFSLSLFLWAGRQLQGWYTRLELMETENTTRVAEARRQKEPKFMVDLVG